MSIRVLDKLPSVEELLEEKPENKDPVWTTKFNAAILREYLGPWPAWLTENRDLIRSREFVRQRREALESYLTLMGVTMPPFFRAVNIIKDCDPDMQKPVLALYSTAKIEALASLVPYQEYFLAEHAEKMPPAANEHLESRMWGAKRYEPRGAYLFTAVVNAYEHAFSFVTHMIGQHIEQFGAMPDEAGFGQLVPQVARHLRDEACYPREKNDIFEYWFAAERNIFSIETETDGTLRLDLKQPAGEQIGEAIQRMYASMPVGQCPVAHSERHLTTAHGCPALFRAKGQTSAFNFVNSEVIGAVRQGLWPTEDMDMKGLVARERLCRNTDMRPQR